MDISNNTNISTQIANSISKLNLNTTKRSVEAQKPKENTPDALLHSSKKDDIQLIDKGKVQAQVEKPANNGINVDEIRQYASYMGEELSIEDINYGLMYGRSVIADFCV
ncbi:MAG: hypothetical protein IJW73_02255 [Candidatus Gastranaerophilales bacterium]|nr:hypothetical protein [Candidatus Gastranaerophilales bacterium]